MMPGMDGISLLKKLRLAGVTVPALFLTAKTDIYQRIEGLDAGADDYLPKPFSTGELLARVRAMLRRKDNFVPDLMEFEELMLNRSTYEISYLGMVQSLSGKEFQLMEMLMSNPGVIISSERLITHIWGWDTSVDTSVENIGYAIPLSVAVRIADNIIDYCFDSDIKRVQRAIVGITVASADSTAVYNSETGYVEIVERVIVYSTEEGYLADSLFLQGDEFVSLTLNGKTKKSLEGIM